MPDLNIQQRIQSVGNTLQGLRPNILPSLRSTLSTRPIIGRVFGGGAPAQGGPAAQFIGALTPFGLPKSPVGLVGNFRGERASEVNAGAYPGSGFRPPT